MIFWVSFFFFMGAAFGFFVLGPFTFNFLAGFQLGSRGAITTIPTFADYLDNLTNLILGCGIAFELPVIVFLLTKIGFITPQFLTTTRKYAVVIILLVAAFITPSPDWYSQTIVFIPLYTLFECSIFVSRWAHKKMKAEGHGHKPMAKADGGVMGAAAPMATPAVPRQQFPAACHLGGSG